MVAQRGTPAYVAAKGAVVMLSKALALDLAEDGIRVNCVCPGITDTPMLRLHANTTADPDRTLKERCERVPLTRMLSPREIADAVLYLSGRQIIRNHGNLAGCRCRLHRCCGVVALIRENPNLK